MKAFLVERNRPLKLYVSEQDRAKIEMRAAEVSLTVSGYLRAVALNHRTRSIYDLDVVADLVRINGDLGRVAGLLKLWLVERPGQGSSRLEVNTMINDFRKLQAQLSAIMGKAIK